MDDEVGVECLGLVDSTLTDSVSAKPPGVHWERWTDARERSIENDLRNMVWSFSFLAGHTSC